MEQLTTIEVMFICMNIIPGLFSALISFFYADDYSLSEDLLVFGLICLVCGFIYLPLRLIRLCIRGF